MTRLTVRCGCGLERRRADDRGSAAVEAAIIAPAVIALLLLVVLAGRVVEAGGEVQSAASAAARAGSQQRTEAAAVEVAEQTVNDNLVDAGMSCTPLAQVKVEADVEPGGQVKVTVRCTVQLGDMALLHLPGSRDFEATATEVVDTFRGEGP
jgi:Flp pilus assembly protein TadG